MLEKIRDYFTGGDKVSHARTIVNSLSNRDHLSKKDTRSLAYSRRVTRRHAMKLVATSVGGLTVVGLGIKKGIDTVQRHTSKEEWVNLPATERINRMETYYYPQFSEFNLREEMVTAVAQFYCETVDCNKTAEQLSNGIHFTTSEQLVEEMEKESNSKFSDTEREVEKKTRLEIVIGNQRGLINTALFEDMVGNIDNYEVSSIGENLAGKNLEAVLLKSLLFHTYTHMNDTEEELSFEAFSLKMPNETGPINFDKAEGFMFTGLNNNGEKRVLRGGEEAITDFIASRVGLKTGSYMFLHPDYRDGSELVAYANMLTGVSDEQFIDYAFGKSPLLSFFEKWGSIKDPNKSDPKNGIMALATISLAVSGIADEEYAKGAIDRWLTN